MRPKTIFLLCLALPCAVLHGQASKWRFGFQLQAGISDLMYRNENAASSIEQFFNEGADMRFSPGLSVLGQYTLSRRVVFQGGLGYELSGYRVKEFEVYATTPDNPEGTYLGKARGTFNYHDLNFSIRAKLKPFRTGQHFYLLAGISNMVNIGRKNSSVLKYETGKVEKYKMDLSASADKITPWNLRGDIGFGFEFKAFGQSTIFVEPVFGYSTLPVFTQYGGKYRQYAAGLNLGLVW